jgi:acyl-CoA synthetase (AMP-forming)/AMP-acid ligase II
LPISIWRAKIGLTHIDHNIMVVIHRWRRAVGEAQVRRMRQPLPQSSGHSRGLAVMGWQMTQSPIFTVVQNHAREQRDHVGLTYLRDGEGDTESWTYGQLWQGVRRIASHLISRGAQGKRVILLYEPGLEYVAAFLATMGAGAVAVPAYPPASRRLAERVRGIVDDCAPAFALTTSAFSSMFSERLPPMSALEWIESDRLPDGAYDPPRRDLDGLAMLQYTSGSTGNPKGTMLSHGNIVANCAAVSAWLGFDPERRGCIWLPPYHDMGLLGGILQPLYAGFPLVFMSPLHFIQQPIRWLRAISRHRITLSGAPDFAYRLCATDIADEDLVGVDLSTWKEAFCGAEPVRPDTMSEFCKRFGGYGFRSSAINPCYGLAESTLIVSGKPAGRGPSFCAFDRAKLDGGAAIASDGAGEKAVQLASCGEVVSEHDVCIVDRSTHLAKVSGEVGEIWVAGPSIAQGYWQRPRETAEVFQCKLAGSERTFLNTGDLGFYHGKELYVTGRSKDLVIIAGKNHYPEDIEQTVERAHDAVYRGGAAAFAIERGSEEAFVILAEVRKEPDGPSPRHITERIIEDVTAVHGVAPNDVVLCRRGAIARTTSGKVRRAASRSLYLAGNIATFE